MQIVTVLSGYWGVQLSGDCHHLTERLMEETTSEVSYEEFLVVLETIKGRSGVEALHQALDQLDDLADNETEGVDL